MVLGRFATLTTGYFLASLWLAQMGTVGCWFPVVLGRFATLTTGYFLASLRLAQMGTRDWQIEN